MDRDYPTNSHASKEGLPAKSRESNQKQVTRVVSGNVVRSKAPLSRRFTEHFFGSSAKDAARNVVGAVLIPAAKDMISDAVSTAVEETLFGERRSSSRRGSSRGRYTNYSNYSNSTTTPNRSSRDRDAPRELSRRSRAQHRFDDIVLSSRREADEVIEQMYDRLNRYDLVLVSEVYQMVGITPEYTDEKWGWIELNNPGVRRTSEGYLLQLPRPEPID